MEGKSDPGVKNYLSSTWTLGQRVDAVATVQSLMEHPGWALMDEIVEDARQRGEQSLARIAERTALAFDPQEAIAFSAKRGVQNGLVFHRDVIASVLESAESARRMLEEAEAEAAAERST